ncbi:MAG TPA: isocitrate lyase/PEP mutase family protein [Gemmatimonadota bacterium]|nr:isocitrate lyase/PEP mutase family protein [Gemmatimonadota bacterium]
MTGSALRHRVASGFVPFVGVYDAFSAAVAGRHADHLFLSGFGFAASQYGLPDVGFVAWAEMVAFAERVRAILPDHGILVDIDDGYGDPDIVAHVIRRMEAAGATGVVLEDQRRPRRCGHLDGRQVLPLEEYLPKLERALHERRELFVVARTDASGAEEIARRLDAFARAGADAVLADGLADPASIQDLRQRTGIPVAFNQIAGGKSPARTARELEEAGVSIGIYSTPCLFAAQGAIDAAVRALLGPDGRLSTGAGAIGLVDCTAVLNGNLERRG